MDESTYYQDRDQLLLFIRSVDKNFKINEKLVGMQSMIDCSTKKIYLLNLSGV